MKKPYPVEVIWKDAHTLFMDWEELDSESSESEDAYTVSTVGHLLPDKKEGHVVVALNLSDSHVGDGIAIPEGMVVSITKLRRSRK